MNATYIELHKTRDFGKKLNATIEFLKQNFKPLFKSLLYIAGPFVIVGSIFITQIYSGFFQNLMQGPESYDLFEGNLTKIIITLIAAIVFLTLGGTAVIGTVNEYIILYEKKKGPNITVPEVWERVKATFLTVLGTMILYAIVFAVAYVAIVIPIALMGALSGALAVIGGIVAFCGFFYLLVVLSHIFIIRAYEGISFSKAFSRCFFLIKEKWWSTFAILIVTGIIHNVISSIFFIPWYATTIIQMMHNLEGNSFSEPSLAMKIFTNVSLLLYFVSSYILYCIPLIALAFQYFNLVERKEARGLMSKIDAFGTEQPKEDDEEHY